MSTSTQAIPFYPTEQEFGGRVFDGVRLVEVEDGGTYVAYGHVAPALMLSALQKMFREDGVAEIGPTHRDAIIGFKHRFGKFTHTGSAEDWFCHFTDKDTTSITIWTA